MTENKVMKRENHTENHTEQNKWKRQKCTNRRPKMTEYDRQKSSETGIIDAAEMNQIKQTFAKREKKEKKNFFLK